MHNFTIGFNHKWWTNPPRFKMQLCLSRSFTGWPTKYWRVWKFENSKSYRRSPNYLHKFYSVTKRMWVLNKKLVMFFFFDMEGNFWSCIKIPRYFFLGNCHSVVLIHLNLNESQADSFCPRCNCKYQTRSLTVIKVVVILVIWVISLLLFYMAFLSILEPMLSKKRGLGLPSSIRGGQGVAYRYV